jgi:TolB-like protein/predicted Ser/Thr protein kinase/Tfp pilus assembly protein PilF
MASVTRICRKCGAKIFYDAPEGLCTGCVLETALGSFSDAVAVVGDPGASDNLARNDVAPTPANKVPARAIKLLGELGDYELLEEVGRGGQGVVFRARQKSLNRIVALKVIGLGQWATPAHLKRFRLEAEAAASLDHPCIVPIYEVGERDGQCYFSMKFVEGGQLDEVVKQTPLSIRQAVELITKVARTVHYAHEHGILHRDIKPGNILLDAKGEPHLTDFGLARLVESESTVTRTLEVLGTPSYMASEQATGNNAKLTGATDVYGLGAVLYQLLTGHPPFAGGTTYETIKLLLETDPRPPRLWNPEIDRDLSTICLKCLEKDPKHRYSSALALAEDLERWLRHEPIQARRIGVFGRGKKWLQRNPTTATVVTLSFALIAALGVIVWKSDLFRRPAAAGIAVLPFENLSNDKEDASFADGVQDDLLTKLAKIADLKVISRTSVMGYQGKQGKQNTREIGKALGVSHVLEGSVRKTGAWLHINTQLIDARTDAHVWAEEYDRDVKDMFAVQSEIAQKVAKQLRAKISPAEKVAIEHAPTANLTAFDLYSRAKNLILAWNYTPNERGNLLQAADLLNQAVTHDPMFFQAYCQLAWVHDQLYFFGHDHTSARLALADAAIQAAFQLRPNAGETHLTRAGHLYRANLDYEGALSELETARQTLPNDARLFQLKGSIERRRPGGNQKEALRNFERAIDLDPRNVFILAQTALSYDVLRRYADEEVLLDRMLAIQPKDVDTKVSRALVELDWKANTRPLHQVMGEIRAKEPDSIQPVADTWLVCALAEHDAAAAASALTALGENRFGYATVRFGPRFVEGLIARMTKDDAKAQSAFAAARAEQEKIVEAQPNYAPVLCVLGLIDAALGAKDEALREGRRAVELLSVEKDEINGPRMITYFAIIAAWVGDKDLACEQLAIATRFPSSPSYGELKLLPFWDPLRGDPCFEKIIASLAPKSN